MRPTLFAALRRLAALFLSLPVSTALAQKTIRIPADQPTIQAGINAAADGDTVLVAPGTYAESLVLVSKRILLNSVSGPATTIIDPGNKAAAVRISNPAGYASIATPSMSGFTIQHGGTVGSAAAGAIVIQNAGALLSNIVVTESQCWGIQILGASASITGSTISSTTNPGSCGATRNGGSGILIDGNLPSIDGLARDSAGTFIQGSTLEGNVQSLPSVASQGGAAIAIEAGAAEIIQNLIRNNNSLAGTGGGIDIGPGGTGLVMNNVITGNNSACGGGGLSFESAGANQTPNVLIANNTFAGNTAVGNAGWSNCSNGSTLWDSGYGTGPSTLLINNIFAGDAAGPLMSCDSPASPIANPAEIGLPGFDHNLFFNPAGPVFGTGCFDVSAKYGNGVGDPRFADAANGDFHLTGGSPAIDTGNNSYLQQALNMLPFSSTVASFDFSNITPRFQDATGKGYPVVDVGAFEFAGQQDAPVTSAILSASSTDGLTWILHGNLQSTVGVPTGPVTFYVDGNNAGTATLDADAIATLPALTLSAGSHFAWVSYSGSAAFSPVTSAHMALFGKLREDVISYTSTPAITAPGQIFGIQLTINAPNLTPSDVNAMPYSLQRVGASTDAEYGYMFQNGSAFSVIIDFSQPTPGLLQWYETFRGEGDLPYTQVVVQHQVATAGTTTTALVSSVNPAVVGQSVTFTTTVSGNGGTPTGSIQLTDNGSPLGTAATASTPFNLTTQALTRGSHTIVATYTPTGTFSSSTASLVQVVDGIDVTAVLTTPAGTSYNGSFPVTVTVTPKMASGTPVNGLANITVDGNVITIPSVVNGVANGTLPALASGNHTLGCIYGGDSTFNMATCAPVMITVPAAVTTLTLTGTPNPAYAQSPVSFTAHLASAGGPIAGQTLVFIADGAPFGTATTNATGDATPGALAFQAGAHALAVSFAGTSSYSAATAQFTEQVNPVPTATMLTATPNPVNQGAPLTLTVTTTATTGMYAPGGTVTISDGGAVVATLTLAAAAAPRVSTAATATTAITTLSPGQHTLVAVYTPSSGSFLSSKSTTVTVTVNPNGLATSTDPQSVTLQTGHHTQVAVTLTSIGSLAGEVRVTCGQLPPLVSCIWGGTNTATLTPGGTAGLTLTIDTDAVIYYEPSQPQKAGLGAHRGLVLAVLLPLGLLTLRRRHLNARWQRRLGLLTLLLAAVTCSGIAACSGSYPDSTPPGTYVLPLTAQTLSGTPVTQTVNLKLVVTP